MSIEVNANGFAHIGVDMNDAIRPIWTLLAYLFPLSAALFTWSIARAPANGNQGTGASTVLAAAPEPTITTSGSKSRGARPVLMASCFLSNPMRPSMRLLPVGGS